jgi:hypothetical protein
MNTEPPPSFEMATYISEAVKETRTLRQEIVDTLNKKDLPVTQCVIALAILAAGHAKQTRMDRKSFVALCDILYQDVQIEAPEIDKKLFGKKQNRSVN